METCPRCDRPLERADDFWYCDNPDCTSRGAPVTTENPSAEPSQTDSKPASS